MKDRYNIFNIGNNTPIKLLDFINHLEQELNIEAKKEMHDMQPGDVVATWADIKELISATGYTPRTNILEGVRKFVMWYKEYYKIPHNNF